MTSWLDSAPKRSGPFEFLQRRLVHRPVTEACRRTGPVNGQHRTSAGPQSWISARRIRGAVTGLSKSKAAIYWLAHDVETQASRARSAACIVQSCAGNPRQESDNPGSKDGAAVACSVCLRLCSCGLKAEGCAGGRRCRRLFSCRVVSSQAAKTMVFTPFLRRQHSL